MHSITTITYTAPCFAAVVDRSCLIYSSNMISGYLYTYSHIRQDTESVLMHGI